MALKLGGLLPVLEVPTEWTDKIGSKVMIGKTSLTMLLSAVIRLRVFYWPTLYKLLRPLRSPLEGWLYKKLSAPKPRGQRRVPMGRKVQPVPKNKSRRFSSVFLAIDAPGEERANCQVDQRAQAESLDAIILKEV